MTPKPSSRLISALSSSANQPQQASGTQRTLRCLHTTRPGHAYASLTATTTEQHLPPYPSPIARYPPSAPREPALSCLPLSQVLRTYLLTSVSSSPALLSACSKTLLRMLESRSWLTSVERNPILKMVLRETFYKQFCGGADRKEVQQCMKQLQDTGFHGIILEYALEVLKDAKSIDEAKDVELWRKGLLATVDMANPSDFVGLKWSGMGANALHLLKAGEPPSKLMDDAMREVCDSAAAKNVRLLPAAEETTTTPTVDKWSLNLQRDYNKSANGSVVYNTYQAYLKGTSDTLARHLADAQKENYTLGIKLVRGAYLASEPRHLIWDTMDDTHAAYDALADAVLRRSYSAELKPLHGTDSAFPAVNVVLATHNAASVRKAQALRSEQAQRGEEKVPLVYAQLQGMADEVSCELIQAGKASASHEKIADVPQVFKCTTWGSMTECLNYLLRRAAENKDAAGRTIESKNAMACELRRRFRGVFGLA